MEVYGLFLFNNPMAKTKLMPEEVRIMKPLAARIKRLREGMKLSKAQLAKKVSTPGRFVDGRTIGAIERYERNFAFSTICRVAEAVGLSQVWMKRDAKRMAQEGEPPVFTLLQRLLDADDDDAIRHITRAIETELIAVANHQKQNPQEASAERRKELKQV